MTKWIEKLSVAQKILLRTIFMLLGLFLLFVVFYAGSLKMLHLSDKEVEWTNLHIAFVVAGVIFIALSLGLDRITKLFDLATGYLSKFTHKKNGGNG